MSDEQTILVIEDELPLASAIRMKLEQSGFSVVTARSLAQTKEYLETIDTICAIWLDHYLLGRGSGIDIMEFLKSERSDWNNIPVFVVTNTASEDKQHRYMQFGVQKFYIKAQHRLDEIIEDIHAHLTNE